MRVVLAGCFLAAGFGVLLLLAVIGVITVAIVRGLLGWKWGKDDV